MAIKDYKDATKIFTDAIFGLRQDTLKNWEKYNPVPEKGEPVVVSDNANGEWLKIGDGVTSWKELPWKRGPVGPMGPVGPRGERGLEVNEKPVSKVVDELPDIGDINKIYCVLNSDKSGYDEYIYIYAQEKPMETSTPEIWGGKEDLSAPADSDGDGIYEITKASELAYVIKTGGGENTYYKLGKDIYLNEKDKIDWTTGTPETGYTPKTWYRNGDVTTFKGTIDGNGHIIYGLYYTDTTATTWGNNGSALIPRVAAGSSATIKNLGIENSYVQYRSAASAFVATNYGTVTMDNCYAGGDVTVKGCLAGALIGHVNGGTFNITNCYSLATTVSSDDSGSGRNQSGLIGDLYGGGLSGSTMKFCYNAKGAITTKNNFPATYEALYATDAGSSVNTQKFIVLSADKMQGEDVLINPDKMNELNEKKSPFIATDKYPALKTFVCIWERITHSVDRIYDPTSENPQSGGAVQEAIDWVENQLKPDQTYKPTSEKAQSGIAVAQALANFGGAENWVKLVDVVLTENLATEFRQVFDKPYKKIRFKIIFKGASGTSLSSVRFKRSKNDGNVPTAQNYLKLNTGGLSTARYFFGTASFDVDGTIIISNGGLGTGTSALTANPGTYSSEVVYEEERQNFPEFYFYLGGSIADDGTLSGNVIGAGTSMQVWGCE